MIAELQVRVLLSVANGYDNRRASEAQVDAWLEAGERGRWSFEEAREAIHHHYASETDYVMPAHVAKIIRAARQDASMRALPPAEPQARGVIDGGWPVGDDPHWGAQNNAGLEQVHTEANVVSCDYCQQGPGQRCTNKHTRNATKIPHNGRLRTAQKAVQGETRSA